MEKNYSVYIHISPNNKYYIGITSQDNISRRWQNGYGYRLQNYFYNAIKKYGWDNFQHEIIANNLTEAEAKNFEILLIENLHSNKADYGYNISSGGGGTSGYKKSEETINKIRIRNSGENSAWFGRTHTKEEIDKISKSHMGELNPMYNRFGKDNPKSKPVICITTGDIFESLSEAHNKTGVSVGNICSCCKGFLKFAGKLQDKTKLKWEYI